jgi:hypothetical protein
MFCQVIILTAIIEILILPTVLYYYNKKTSANTANNGLFLSKLVYYYNRKTVSNIANNGVFG